MIRYLVYPVLLLNIKIIRIREGFRYPKVECWRYCIPAAKDIRVRIISKEKKKRNIRKDKKVKINITSKPNKTRK